MLAQIQELFRPAETQAQERLAVLELELDSIAKETSSRFCRGNVAVQFGLIDTAEELDAQREATIARRA